ncbi:uncharacterized protein RJT21DRAFT_13170 [Scheffersomyces amazonensis]|uniref:uncharacterized protein n=1 Tax=Scheffersomyces amazonensis TaxID=1078765 RepID=UPI00315D9BAA
MSLLQSPQASNALSEIRSVDSKNDLQLVTDPLEVIEIINDQEVRNYKLGVILLVVAVSTWIIGLELVNGILKGDDYHKPWLFAVITGSCFTLNLVPEVYFFFKNIIITSLWKSKSCSDTPKISSSEPRIGSSTSHHKSIEKLLDDDYIHQPRQLTSGEIFILALQMAIIYYLYNLFAMSSLQFTSASNQTVLGSTTSIFTLLISTYLKIDKFTLKKVICVAISCFGVFLVNFSESSKEPKDGNKFVPKNPKLGNSLALCGALMYALYLIVMKVRVGTGAQTTNERKLFGYVGILTFLLGIPILYFADKFNMEKFEFPPPSNSILISIIVNGTFSVISDYTTILAMLLTSPLVTSLSLTSAIPITIFIDWIIMVITSDGESKTSKGFSYFLGIISILLAVILVNINIASENELIEEVIEDALEEAIREDEVLSPLLSPLLSPHPNNPIEVNSPHFPIQVGVSGSTLLASFSPKLGSKSQKQPPLIRQLSGFNLNQNGFNYSEGNQSSPLNPNHSSKLYTVDPRQQASLVVISGGNHQYQVKNLDVPTSSSDIDSRLDEYDEEEEI